MNLVLSGPIDDSLRNLVVALTQPRRVVRLHDRADRMEGAADEDSVRTEVAALCNAARVDHAYIEEGITFADFKLLAMDMDSTLITIECIDEIADYAGKKAEVSAITEAAMRGEIDFEASLRQRVAALAGLDISTLERVYDERLKISGGARIAIDLAKCAGVRVVLVSGGFDYFTKRLTAELALDEGFANQLEVCNQKLTGHLVGQVIGPERKAAVVKEQLNALGCLGNKGIVLGDGANDIPMMRCVTNSIAYVANQRVRKAAKHQISFGDFTVLVDWLRPTA